MMPFCLTGNVKIVSLCQHDSAQGMAKEVLAPGLTRS
jgi:hypothetical protein